MPQAPALESGDHRLERDVAIGIIKRISPSQVQETVDDAVATIAQGLVARGVGKLVVAGGETSGAVVQRLGVTSLRIGPEIDPGVPWTFASPAGLHLALKSGNFGARDFFLKAFSHG